MSWNYFQPTRVIFGVDILTKIEKYVSPFNPKKILLVTGKKSMKKFGVTDRIIEYLKEYEVFVYDNVEPHPSIKIVEDGLEVLKSEKCDFVIGLGGGSAIDVAKAVSILKENPGSLSEYLEKKRKIVKRGLPLIAIPSTAGTGSEVTQYASIIDEGKKVKRSLSHEYIHPRVAIVDPMLTITMPKFVTATTGLDALSQCIEAYWSIYAQPISDGFSLKGIKLIFKNLVRAYNFPENIEFRRYMALASLLSGMAIDITRTTIVHSVSYPLTVFFSVPHGLACSLTLPSFLKYNSEVAEERINDIVRAAGARTIDEGINKLKQLISEIGLPTRLREVGVREDDIELIVEKGFRPDRAGNNPRKVTAEDVRAILLEIA